MRMNDYSEMFLKLGEMVESGEVELEEIQDTLESLEVSASDKAENVAKMIDNLQAQAKMFKDEAKRINDKAKTLQNNADYLTNNLEIFLQSTGNEKMQAGLYNLGYDKLPDIVQINNEDSVPKAFKKYETVIKIDKRSLIKVLKDGEKVRGAELETGRKKFKVKK